MQRAALAFVGRDVLEDGGGSAVLGDDDRAVAFCGPVDEVGGAAFERGDGLDVLGEIHGADLSTVFSATGMVWTARCAAVVRLCGFARQDLADALV